MLIHCSDSRVNEQEIFSAQPGTLFTAGNIANRFDEEDLNSYVSSLLIVLVIGLKRDTSFPGMRYSPLLWAPSMLSMSLF